MRTKPHHNKMTTKTTTPHQNDKTTPHHRAEQLVAVIFIAITILLVATSCDNSTVTDYNSRSIEDMKKDQAELELTLEALAIDISELEDRVSELEGNEDSETSSDNTDSNTSGNQGSESPSGNEDSNTSVPESSENSLGVVRVAPGEAIQIRSLNVLSGDSAFLGIGNQRGIELAIGGYGEVLGFPVDLGAGVDGFCAADSGQTAAQTIVADERVLGVVGPSCSITATAAAPLITKAGMVMIAPSNTSPALTSDLAGNPGTEHVEGYFRTAHNDLFQGKAVADFLYTKMGLRTAATIHDGDPYSQGLATAFAEAFEALGGTTQSGRVNKETINMEPVLIELAASEPEALFFPVFRPVGDFIAEQAREVPGLENTNLISAPSLGDDFMRLPQSEGMFFSGPDIRIGVNTNQATGLSAEEVLADYMSRYGEEPSSPYWAHSYDATTMLLDAIAAAATVTENGSLVIDRAEIRKALYSTEDYKGVIGTLSCDEFGDCGTQRLIIIHHLDPENPGESRNNIVFEYAP